MPERSYAIFYASTHFYTHLRGLRGFFSHLVALLHDLTLFYELVRAFAHVYADSVLSFTYFFRTLRTFTVFYAVLRGLLTRFFAL